MDREPDGDIGAEGLPQGLFVNQASGMVALQAGCGPARAFDLLVAYAALHDCTVDEVASAVIDRRVRFNT